MSLLKHLFRVTVVLHLDRDLFRLCRIAQRARNFETLEAWILETLGNAVSGRNVLPQ